MVGVRRSGRVGIMIEVEAVAVVKREGVVGVVGGVEGAIFGFVVLHMPSSRRIR
jgi:hypothetical protein